MLQPKIHMALIQSAWLKSGWMNTNGCTIFIVQIYWYAGKYAP